MNELTFSFTDCTPVLQGPQFSISSDLSDRSDYVVIVQAARDFRGWITVTAESVIRNVVQAFFKFVCEAKAVFNRQVLIRLGGLRL